jgi:hypothetical protein
MQQQCTLWPECGCRWLLERYANLLLDDDTIWSLEDLEVGEDMIFVTLCCVQKYCPDPRIRQSIKQQLRKSFWIRQKIKSPMGGWS